MEGTQKELDNYVNASEIVANYYNNLIERLRYASNSDKIALNDKIIYCIIMARCAMDMDGFASIWEQGLNELEALFLIDALKMLDEPELAECFNRCYRILKHAGFFDKLPREVDSETEEKLSIIEAEVRENDKLWFLDTKLVSLITNQN